MKRQLCVLLLFASWPGSACEAPDPRSPMHGPASPPAPVPPLEAQVRELAASSRPGERHAALAPLAGEWEVTLSSLSPEGREIEPFRGRATIEWVLGGRFLRWDARIDFAGASGTTTGYLGYDLRSGQYQLMMISDLATGMEVARGSGDLAGAGVVFALEQVDPRSGARVRAKSRLRLIAHDQFVLEQLVTEPDGLDRVARVSHYRRAAAATH